MRNLPLTLAILKHTKKFPKYRAKMLENNYFPTVIRADFFTPHNVIIITNQCKMSELSGAHSTSLRVFTNCSPGYSSPVSLQFYPKTALFLLSPSAGILFTVRICWHSLHHLSTMPGQIQNDSNTLGHNFNNISKTCHGGQIPHCQQNMFHYMMYKVV